MITLLLSVIDIIFILNVYNFHKYTKTNHKSETQ